MSDTTQSPPRRRWLARLLVLLLLALGMVLVLDTTGRLPPDIEQACEDAGLCGHRTVHDVLERILPGSTRATRIEFPVAASPGTQQATHALVLAERRGDDWFITLHIDALPGAPSYSLIQVLATRERAPEGQAKTLTLLDTNRQPVIAGRWEVTVTAPNEIFRNRDWVLRYRADTIDALAVSEDIAPHIRQTWSIR